MKPFPQDFVWGAASSAYQIEGYSTADGGRKSIWDTFCHTPGKILYNDHGDIACDAYHRYAEDIALLKEMGARAYRFSTSWAGSSPTPTGSGTMQALPTMTAWWTCAWLPASRPI